MNGLKKCLRAIAAAPLAAALLTAAAGCGPFSAESEIDRVKHTVEMVLTSNDPKICDELFTQRFLEAASGQRGGRAIAVCKRKQVKAASTAESVKFIAVTIDGGRARAVFSIAGGSLDGQTATAMLLLNRGWKVVSVRSSAPPPSPAELRSIADRALRQALADRPDLSRRQASCIVAYLRRSASDAQLAADLKELRAGQVPDDLRAAVQACR
jgi:hypothetical protein